MIKINLDETVKVKLTDLSKDINYKRHGSSVLFKR